MARSSDSDSRRPWPPRREGREPIGNDSISAIGVVVRKYSTKAGRSTR
jgi:hypothetical protein